MMIVSGAAGVRRALQRGLVLVDHRAALQSHAGARRGRDTTVAASSSIGALGTPSTTSLTPGVRAIPDAWPTSSRASA